MSTDDVTQPQMGQCSITGKVVPVDELVNLNGQLVCAEGKAILLERLKAGEAMPGEMQTPTQLRRFGCIFLDGIIIGVPSAIVGVAAGSTQNLVIVGASGLVMQTIGVAYFAMLHGNGGRTVGKMAGKLRVVNLDGSPISMNTAFVRALAYAGVGLLSGLAALTGEQSVVTTANLIVGAYGLTNAIACLVDSARQRTIHDRIAGTRVISVG